MREEKKLGRNPALFYKTFVVGVIVLFVGVGIQPAFATAQQEVEVDIEPKDYLFQTIIDIPNNQDIKNLIEQYKYDLFKVDIDRNFYRKLFLRNPRLYHSIIFSKSSLTSEYLDKCYKNGIKITNLLGEDKVLENIEKIEITDTSIFDEFNNIINRDEKLSNRLKTLKEMNTEKNSYMPSWENYPIICSIMSSMIIFIAPIFWIFTIVDYISYWFFSLLNLNKIANIFYYLEIIKELATFGFIFCLVFIMFIVLECVDIFPY